MKVLNLLTEMLRPHYCRSCGRMVRLLAGQPSSSLVWHGLCVGAAWHDRCASEPRRMGSAFTSEPDSTDST
jgi:hypothetical protein